MINFVFMPENQTFLTNGKVPKSSSTEKSAYDTSMCLNLIIHLSDT